MLIHHLINNYKINQYRNNNNVNYVNIIIVVIRINRRIKKILIIVEVHSIDIHNDNYRDNIYLKLNNVLNN